MQVELSSEELSVICKALDYMNNAEADLICSRLSESMFELQELESMDFDDCVGGACKL